MRVTAAIDSDVVDLGCGGKVTAEIAGRLPQGSIIAIDNSAAMIALANRRYPSSSYPNMVFKRPEKSSVSVYLNLEVRPFG